MGLLARVVQFGDRHRCWMREQRGFMRADLRGSLVRSERYACTYCCAADARDNSRPNTSTDAKPDPGSDTSTNKCADLRAHTRADAGARAYAGANGCPDKRRR